MVSDETIRYTSKLFIAKYSSIGSIIPDIATLSRSEYLKPA
jgi:hypothetical protein